MDFCESGYIEWFGLTSPSDNSLRESIDPRNKMLARKQDCAKDRCGLNKTKKRKTLAVAS